MSKFVTDHQAECIVASNGGLILQHEHRFQEQTTDQDLEGTLILLWVKESELGL